MRYHYLLLFLTLLTFQFGHTQALYDTAWEKSPYFDTNFLVQYEKVQEKLFEDGFEKVYFSTPDNIKICGLFKEAPNARATMVFCNGWFPGRKESLTTLFHMLRDQNINMLFFDARNHGESGGSSFQNLLAHVMPTHWFRQIRPLFSNWFMYGTSEFKDILSAVNYAKKRDDAPIVIFGTCAGAFHAAHALIDLGKQSKELNIKGFIFDSGWSSLYTASKGALSDRLNQSIQNAYSFVGKTKTEVQESILYRVTSSIINSNLTLFHNVLVALPFKHRDGQMHLQDKIHRISVPIFFIHSLDDNAVPIADVVSLMPQCASASCWWIAHSKHACHYLKHKHEYRQRILGFLDRTLGKQKTQIA